MATVKVPKERRPGEYRVALAPEEVALITREGHAVEIESDAGDASGFSNDSYREFGAKIVWQDEIWAENALVVKVKELQQKEFGKVKAESTIMLFPHFKGDKIQRSFFEGAATRNIFAIPYEELVIDGVAPVLAEMSKIAGEISAGLVVEYLRTDRGGPGILPGEATVQILGAGNVGWRAMEVLQGIVKRIHIHNLGFDVLPPYINVFPHESSDETIHEFLIESDAVICAAKSRDGAPKLVTYDMIYDTKPKTIFIDVPIDEGGCCEFSLNTTWDDPIRCVAAGRKGIRQLGISNLPGAVPRSSSKRFSKAVLPFVLTALNLLDHGVRPTSAGAIVNALTHQMEKEVCN